MIVSTSSVPHVVMNDDHISKTYVGAHGTGRALYDVKTCRQAAVGTTSGTPRDAYVFVCVCVSSLFLRDCDEVV